MSLWQRVTGFFERRQMTDSQLYSLLVGDSATYAGPVVNEDNAMRYSAVYACIRVISESIASLPLMLYKQNGRNKNKATEHALFPVLHDLANTEMTAFEWRELAISHVLAWGNHWSQIQTDTKSNNVIALWPLNPSRMEDWERRSDQIWWKYRNPDNSIRWFPATHLHHIKGLGNGIQGFSPIRQAGRQAIGLGLATEEFGSRFFSNGANLGKVLKHPGKLSKEAYARLQQSYANENSGLSNAHKTKILEEGLSIEAIGIPPDEAQFIETRKFQVTEIARIFRVPPHMLADLDRATFSNIEQQSLNFVLYTLMPWLVRHEQAIYKDLLLPSERVNLFAKYNVAGMLRGDTLSRYQAHNTGINAGFLTRNEARDLEDLNPLDGLDEPLLPLNMMEANAQPPAPAPGATPVRRSDKSTIETRAKTSADRRALMNRNVRLFEEAASRVVKREVTDIRKAANSKLGKRSIDSFQTWLDGFYAQLREWFPDYFRNIMLTYAESIMHSVAAELNGEPAPLDDKLKKWVEEYLAKYTEVYAVGGEKQLRALLVEAEDEQAAVIAIEDRMSGWEDTKAGKEGFSQAFEAGNALAIFGYVAGGVSILQWSARGESCPFCRKMDGRRIKTHGEFFKEGDTVHADGIDPLPVLRTVKHGPLHQGCDCTVIAG